MKAEWDRLPYNHKGIDMEDNNLRNAISNLVFEINEEQLSLATLRERVARAEVRIFHKQNRLRELRKQLS